MLVKPPLHPLGPPSEPENTGGCSSRITTQTQLSQGQQDRFALYNIRKIRPFLSEHATQLLLQALVLFRLDYCNALLAGLPASSKHLQLNPECGCKINL